uniref:Uncharacterized protein n=1 Tax=Marseillevirus LCMAC103 TaxID=2506604 RepID=A0A481YVF6_9VIRU|nr:MAG: hypothetical protein LCMAC103_02190 [Marseillevirus LCMAC103]
MCFDARTSAVAAVIGFASAWAAFSIQEHLLGIFIAVYALMQVAEFMIWRALDAGSKVWNRRGTFLAASTLKLHALVVVGTLLALQWGKLKTRKSTRNALLALFAAAIVVAVTAAPAPASTQPGCSKGCRLDWQFGASYSLQVLIIAAALFIGARRLFPSVAVFFSGAFFFAMLMSKVDPQTTPKAAASTVWCLVVALFAPIIVGHLWWKSRKGKAS